MKQWNSQGLNPNPKVTGPNSLSTPAVCPQNYRPELQLKLHKWKTLDSRQKAMPPVLKLLWNISLSCIWALPSLSATHVLSGRAETPPNCVLVCTERRRYRTLPRSRLWAVFETMPYHQYLLPSKWSRLWEASVCVRDLLLLDPLPVLNGEAVWAWENRP